MMNKKMKLLLKNTLGILVLLPIIFCGIFMAGCSNLGGTDEAASSLSSLPSTETENTNNTPSQFYGEGVKVFLTLPGTQNNSSAARSAVPSGFTDSGGDLVFAAAITASGTPSDADLVAATYTAATASEPASVVVPFEVSATARTNYVLDIYAFANGTTSFSKTSALLHGSTKITIAANSASATAAAFVQMTSNTSSTANGNVNLAISIPAGYYLRCGTSGFSVSANSVTATIAAGVYTAEFSLLSDDSDENSVVYAWSEVINVYPGMTTDKWNSGAVTASGALEITVSQIYSTFYVRGTGGSWIAGIDSVAGDDTTGNGSLGKPYATINKAIDAIKATTTAASYTIYVDGTFTASGSTPVADFTGITSGCSITLKGLNATNKATLDGNNTARVIVAGTNAASLNLNLTLENLTITKGKYGGRGGGISICSTGGNTYKIQNCKIINCAADYGAGIYHEKGRLSFTNCEISGNNASNYSGGGVYSGGSANAAVTFANTKIESNTAQNGGGIFIGGGSKATISDGTVTIKSNVATRDSSSGSGGQGICVWEGILELKGGAKIDSSNNIRLMSGASDTAPHLKITGTLTETGTVATIWPRSYTSGTVVLEADDAAFITANYSKFTLSDTSTYEICPDSATPTQAILAKPLITIATAADFTTELNSNPNANIKLAADIDISGNSTLYTTTPFNGIIDGNGHTITISADNQFADANSGDFAVCIFGKIGSNGVIKNLTVSSSDIAVGSGASFGGICKDNDGTIENCTNNINFSSSASTRDVGGICINNNGTIKNCTNNGNLALTTSTGWGNCPNVGGIAATNAGTIENCTNNGTLDCNQNLGPFVGRKDSGTVTGCTDTKEITVKGSGR